MMVLLVWEDACDLDAEPWTTSTDHAHKPHLIYQVGFLLRADEQGVTLTSAWHPEHVGMRSQIPAGMVRQMTPIQPITKNARATRKRS